MGAIQNAMGGLAITALGGVAAGKHISNQESQVQETRANTEELRKLTSSDLPKDEKGGTLTAQGFMKNVQNAKGPSLNQIQAMMLADQNLGLSQAGKAEVNNRIKANRTRIKTRKGGKR